MAAPVLIIPIATPQDMAPAAMRQVMEVNFFGPAFLTATEWGGGGETRLSSPCLIPKNTTNFQMVDHRAGYFLAHIFLNIWFQCFPLHL